MRRASVVLLASALVLAAAPTPARSAIDGPPLTPVLVRLAPGGAPAAIADEVVAAFGGSVGFVYSHAVTGFSAALPAAAVTALERNPRVLSVTPDREVSIAAQETPTGFDRSEADLTPRSSVPLDTTTCPAAETCTDVDVAVLDTGTNAHPDLHVVQRTDCSTVLPFGGSCSDGTGLDGHGHGTHVAGTVGAFDNAIGGVGIVPGARITSVKVLGDDGTGLLSGIVAGIDWVAARSGTIDVVNMSLAGQFSDPTFDAAISGAVARGIVFAVAAGNSSADAAGFSPASHPQVLTVSAVADADGGAGGLSAFRCRKDQTDDVFASFSNFGAVVDLAAPGVCILSTWNDGGYRTISGTSMATPHVAGAAALYVAIHGRDVDADGDSDGADAATVRSALVADGTPQTAACGFTGDPDAFPEPLLFLNGPAFGGSGVCQQEAVDATPPSAPSSLAAAADGYPVDLTWTAATEPDSGILEYRLYRDTVPSTGETLLTPLPYDASSYRDRATTPGTTYRYSMEAVNLQSGVSPRSDPAEAATSTDDPTDAGWWALDDGSGVTAADTTAWRRSGLLTNGPAWTAGKEGGALQLDGSDDHLVLDPSVMDGHGDVSASLWIKTTKTAEQALVSGANAGNDNEFLLLLVNPTTLRLFVGYTATAGVEWTMSSVADGTWHHLTVVRNQTANTVTAYRDGVSLGTWGLGVTMTSLDVDGLVMGQDQDTVGGGFQIAQAVSGAVDGVRVFTRVLTQAEIDILSLRDLSPPTGPDTLTAVASGSALDLAWSAAEDADSGILTYEIWRDDGAGGPMAKWAALPGTQTTWRDTAVRAGTAYAYEVVARNGSDVAGPPSPRELVTTGPGDPTLAGWWSLDDGAGTSAADWSGHGRNGATLGNPVWGSGKVGGALVLDGTGDAVTLDAGVVDGLDDLTVTLWFRTTKTGIQAMVSGANAGNDGEFLLVPVSATNIRFYTGVTFETHVWWDVPSISDGGWHHLAVVRDGTGDRATLYLDAVSYGAKAADFGPLTIDPGGLVLGQEQDTVGGGFDPNQAFVGSFDEVRLYDRLLTVDEIRDLAGLGQPTVDTTPPAAPAGLAATSGPSLVTLDWTDNTETDLASYTVLRSTTAGGPYAEVATGLTVSQHTDTSVVSGTTYFYAVTALDTAGNESARSVEAAATPTDPPVVTDVTASSETTLAGTVIAGDRTATIADDGVYEVLREHHTGGRPAQRISTLDHRWTFQVGTPDSISLVVDAHRPINVEGDDFVFEYSVDGVTFVPLTTVTEAVDDGPLVVDLPTGAAGTIVVRVVDTDRTPGAATLDDVYVDLLLLRVTTSGTSTPPQDALASSESTLYGAATGGLVATHASDDVYEQIVEETWAGGKRTRLSQQWTFTVAKGSSVTLFVEAHRTAGTEAFVVAWSVDGVTWDDVGTIADPVDVAQSFPLPSSLTGTVHVRVTDADPRDPTVDAVLVDHLVIRSLP